MKFYSSLTNTVWNRKIKNKWNFSDVVLNYYFPETRYLVKNQLYILVTVFLFFHLTLIGQNYVQFNNLEGSHKESFHFISEIDKDKVFIISSNYSKNDSNSILFSRMFNLKTISLEWTKKSLTFDSFGYPSSFWKNKEENLIISGIGIKDFNTRNDNSFLSEITPDGDILWFTACSGNGRIYPSDVTEIDDGYITSGWEIRPIDTVNFSDLSTSNAYLRKFDLKGDSLWTVYFSDVGNLNFKGQNVVTGDFNSVYFFYLKDVNQGQSFSLIKLDGHTGDIFWEKEIDFNDNDFGIYDVIRLENNNLLIRGDSYDFIGCRPLILWEIDGEGNIVRKKDYFPEIKCLYGNDFKKTNDGGFIAVTNSSYPNLVKFDKEYNVEWIKAYEIEYQEMYATGVVQLENGSYVLIGNYRYKSKIEAAGWLIRTDSKGELTSVFYNTDPKLEMKIFPNPTHSFVNISSPEIDVNNLTMKLINSKGKNIFISKFEKRIDLAEYALGIYFLHVFDNGQLIRIEKIVKI